MVVVQNSGLTGDPSTATMSIRARARARAWLWCRTQD